jgi:hypothetical protein
VIPANSRAAWVPELLTGQARLKAIDAAVTWVRESPTATGALFFHPADNEWKPPTAAVAAFAKEAEESSRNYDRFHPSEDGQTVLAFVSDYDSFNIAQRAAQASWTSDAIGTLAIVSDGLFGISGWANAREAFDLGKGRTVLNPFPASQVEILEQLISGLSSPSKGMGRDAVDRAVRKLRLRNDFDAAMNVGWAMAHNTPARSLVRLRQLLNES